MSKIPGFNPKIDFTSSIKSPLHDFLAGSPPHLTTVNNISTLGNSFSGFHTSTTHIADLNTHLLKLNTPIEPITPQPLNNPHVAKVTQSSVPKYENPYARAFMDGFALDPAKAVASAFNPKNRTDPLNYSSKLPTLEDVRAKALAVVDIFNPKKDSNPLNYGSNPNKLIDFLKKPAAARVLGSFFSPSPTSKLSAAKSISNVVTTPIDPNLFSARTGGMFGPHTRTFNYTEFDGNGFPIIHGNNEKLVKGASNSVDLPATTAPSRLNAYGEFMTVQDDELVRQYSKRLAGPMNGALWRGDAGPDALAVAHRLDKVLDDFPVYRGNVYRQVDLDPDQAAMYQVGKIVTDRGYMSTSRAVDGTLSTASPRNTLFVVNSETGRSVERVSDYIEEQEVLFKRESQFKVTNISIDAKTGQRVVHLDEVVDSTKTGNLREAFIDPYTPAPKDWGVGNRFHWAKEYIANTKKSPPAPGSRSEQLANELQAALDKAKYGEPTDFGRALLNHDDVNQEIRLILSRYK